MVVGFADSGDRLLREGKGGFPLPGGGARLKKKHRRGKSVSRHEGEKYERRASGETKIARTPPKGPWVLSFVRSFFHSHRVFPSVSSLYNQKNVMYRSSRSSPRRVVFGFVFPAKFPAYKLLPPLC